MQERIFEIFSSSLLIGTEQFSELVKFAQSVSPEFAEEVAVSRSMQLMEIFKSMANGYSPLQAKLEIAEIIGGKNATNLAESIIDKARELNIIR